MKERERDREERDRERERQTDRRRWSAFLKGKFDFQWSADK